MEAGFIIEAGGWNEFEILLLKFEMFAFKGVELTLLSSIMSSLLRLNGLYIWL